MSQNQTPRTNSELESRIGAVLARQQKFSGRNQTEIAKKVLDSIKKDGLSEHQGLSVRTVLERLGHMGLHETVEVTVDEQGNFILLKGPRALALVQ